MKKLKLKKKVKRILILFVVLIVGLIFGINKYKEYKYKQTNEYKLTQVGYSLEESKFIIEKLNSKNEKYFVENEKSDLVINVLKEKYFLEKNLYRYLDYKSENKKKDLSDVISIVNVGADKEWYDVKSIKNTDVSKKELMLVNKFYSLSETFEPENITDISLSYSYSGNSVSQVANDAYIDMATQAKEDGISLMANSTYRTYTRQDEIYKDFYYSKGISYADQYAARPGHSEHQTGLALDIFTSGVSTTSDFHESDAYKWLNNNAHLYGFILRYPEGKEYLTGYNYESWHYRYVGKEVAQQIKELDITFDEYYAYFIEK